MCFWLNTDILETETLSKCPHPHGATVQLARRRANGEVSQLSFIIYLNDDFTSGETAVMKSVITPKRGVALFFLHELLHEGRPVLGGTKYVMRTDVMYGRVGETRG